MTALRNIDYFQIVSIFARVAELADALDSGSSVRKDVGVQIPSLAYPQIHDYSVKKKQRPKKSRTSQPSKSGQGKQKTPSAERTLEGQLKIHREGYGFLLSEIPEKPDVFIPARRMEGAMDGDRVQASVGVNPRDGRLEGSVLKILTRGRQFVVGEIKQIRGRIFAEVVENGRVMEFVIPPEKMDGAKVGQSVGVKILKYPEGYEQGLGEVVQVFADRGKVKTETEVIILEHQLRREFPRESVQEAQVIQQNPGIELDNGRRDLRELPFVTIDGETAKDFDDAVLVRREGDGYRLWVSIADVSHYVKPGTALDREAYARGTSVYFPGYCIPMLPEELSNDICSLRPLEDRMSFTCELAVDSFGNPSDSRCYKSLIRSKARLTYKQVARAIIDNDPAVQQPISELLPMLREALELSRLMRKIRFARGSIDFDMPEAEFIMNLEENDAETIVKAERSEAHFLIEEFMIAANEAVARLITERNQPGLYRVHDDPDPEKVQNFKILLNNLGFQFAFPKKPDPRFFNHVLAKVKGHSEEQLIQHILLRSMKQAVYSPENIGHFGLASTCYTHFTSPIRRYPDLVVHRILERILGSGGRPDARQREIRTRDLAQIASHTSRRERIAMEAEWEALDLLVAIFMQRFVGQKFKGVVARIAKFGFFVQLFDYFVQGTVLLEDLKDDYYIFDEKKHRLRGRRGGKVFKIGTELEVTVGKVDLLERKVYFALDQAQSPRPKGQAQKSAGGPRNSRRSRRRKSRRSP